MSRRTLAVLTLALLAVSGACGEDGGDDTDVGTPLTSDSTTTSTESASPPPAATLIEVLVVGGNVEGGVRRERVKVGDDVIIRVTSDLADEVHFHGYNLSAAVGPGRIAEIAFEATIPGVFEVELEERGREILQLEVSP